jgi:hypothetical protein
MEWPFLIPLAPFLMVVGIVWIKTQARLEEKRIAAGTANRSEPDPQQARQIAELQERVRVLERIVTDKNSGYDLAAQIEALRDERPIEQRLETPELQGRI